MVLPSLPTLFTLALLGTLAGLLVIAAIGDIRHFIISNRLCLTVALLGLVYTLADVNLPDAQLLQGSIKWHLIATLAIALVIFVVCAIFFALKLMGGGDVKLIAAIALWTGPRWTLDFLLVTAIAGGLVTLGVLLLSLRKGRNRGRCFTDCKDFWRDNAGHSGPLRRRHCHRRIVRSHPDGI